MSKFALRSLQLKERAEPPYCVAFVRSVTYLDDAACVRSSERQYPALCPPGYKPAGDHPYDTPILWLGFAESVERARSKALGMKKDLELIRQGKEPPSVFIEEIRIRAVREE